MHILPFCGTTKALRSFFGASSLGRIAFSQAINNGGSYWFLLGGLYKPLCNVS